MIHAMTVVWSFPTRILFGEGSVAETATELERLAVKHPFIVTDPGVVRAGLIDEVTKTLRQANIPFDVFDGISSNPIEKEVLAAAQAYRDAGSDGVISVGGGSPLDVGKLVRVCVTHDVPLVELDDAKNGGEKITNKLPPMVAIPTTAGTGSEVGRSGVVTIESTRRKTVIFAPSMMPSVAILDPTLTVSMPPQVTATTGFDALTHCIEAYCALGDHPMADAIAVEGVHLVALHLETAVSDSKNLTARGGMCKAAMMGAVAFQKGLGACHSLAHPLSAEIGIHHGLANALCLPAVLDFNRSVVGAKIARIARILGVRGEDVETLAFECSGAVRAMRRRMGLPEGLAAVGVQEDALPRLASLALEDACHSLNPRPCKQEDLLALYRASM